MLAISIILSHKIRSAIGIDYNNLSSANDYKVAHDWRYLARSHKKSMLTANEELASPKVKVG
jgi:hypothetical protein